jgi:hypothetical protein
MAPSSKLTLDQEKLVYELSQKGLKDQEIAALLADQGVLVTRQTVGNARRRVEQRAMAAPPIEAQDPATGIQVELSDEQHLAATLRDLSALFQQIRRGCKSRTVAPEQLEELIAIAHVLPKIATARQRVRQPDENPRPPKDPLPQPEQEEPERKLTPIFRVRDAAQA